MESEASLRTRLVDVGVDLVRAEGPSSLGLREIARRAGVSHGAPRRYFPTHQALLSAIARRGFADLTTRFADGVDAGAAPRTQLSALAHVYVTFARECPGMFELMFRHDLLRGQADADGQPKLREASLPLFARLVDLIDRHQRGRGPRGIPTEVTAVALWSNLHGIAQLGSWGALGLALGDDDPARAHEQFDGLITAVLDAHLGGAGA